MSLPALLHCGDEEFERRIGAMDQRVCKVTGQRNTRLAPFY